MPKVEKLFVFNFLSSTDAKADYYRDMLGRAHSEAAASYAMQYSVAIVGPVSYSVLSGHAVGYDKLREDGSPDEIWIYGSAVNKLLFQILETADEKVIIRNKSNKGKILDWYLRHCTRAISSVS